MSGDVLVLLAALLQLPLAQTAPVEPFYVTFGSAVRVPSVTLPAGSYVFTAGTPIAGQMVVDIYRASDMTPLASFLAIESSLPRDAEAAIVDYAGSSPPYLRAWFHRALRHGFEFVYHPEEAAGIFAASGVSVPAAVFRGRATLTGLLPIDHIDDQYRLGSPDRDSGASDDHLALARVAVLAHLPSVPPDIAFRLTLLNRQIADLQRAEPGEVEHRLALAIATVDNTAMSGDAELAHVLERVRLRLGQFRASLR